MSTDRRFLRETSYGGVTVRGEDVLVITQAGKRRVTALPKGGQERGETGEQTAVREFLGDVEYWYRRSGRRVFKTVRFYLCDFVSGSTEDHDHEVEDARWMPLADAATGLSYPGERALIESVLSKRASGR